MNIVVLVVCVGILLLAIGVCISHYLWFDKCSEK